jgi:hypothetical protein
MRRRVPRAKYDEAVMLYLRERRRRLDVEEKLDEKDAAIRQMQGLVQHQRDQQPNAPLPYPEPLTGDAELRRQLALAKRALAETAARCTELQQANVSLTAQLAESREGAVS